MVRSSPGPTRAADAPEVPERGFVGGVGKPGRQLPVRAFLGAVASVGLLLLAWEAASTWVISERLVPRPTTLVRTAIPMFVEGGLIGHVAISLRRVFLGFVWGGSVAIVVGTLIGRIQVISQLANWPLQFVRFLSPTALIPIAIIWFGIGEMSKVFLIFWGTFLFSVITIIQGVQMTPTSRVRAARCLGTPERAILTKIVLPSAVPYIVGGLRTAMAASFMAIIPAEMLAAQSGLGYLLHQAAITIRTDRAFVVLVVFGMLGLLTDTLYRAVTGHFLRRFMWT